MAERLPAITSSATSETIDAVPQPQSSSVPSTSTDSALATATPSLTTSGGLENTLTSTSSDSVGGLIPSSRILHTSSSISGVVPASVVSAGLTLPLTQSAFSSSIVSETSPLSLPTASSATTTTTEQTAIVAPAATTTSTTTSATSSSSGPPLKVILPAVIVPVSIIAFVIFWWFMRRRYKNHLKNEPDYLVFNGATKENPRSDSSLSNTTPHARGRAYKMLTKSAAREVTRSITPPERPAFCNDDLGNVRSAQPVNHNVFRQIDPEQEGLVDHARGDSRTYHHFSSPRRKDYRNDRTGGPNFIDTNQTSDGLATQPGRVVSPTSSKALDMNPSLRKPVPTSIDTTAAGSPVSQYSPMREVSAIDGIAFATSRHHGVVSPLQIQERATTGYERNEEISPVLSPQLPPPATRSQLIPREFMSSTNTRHLENTANPAINPNDTLLSPVSTGQPNQGIDRLSMISGMDEYDEDDAESDISSLNEVDRFEIESQNASRSQIALQNFVGSDRSGLTNGPNTALDSSRIGNQTATHSAYRW